MAETKHFLNEIDRQDFGDLRNEVNLFIQKYSEASNNIPKFK